MKYLSKTVHGIYVFSIRLIITVLFLILCFSHVQTADAQQLGYIITYHGSITSDEDDNRLHHPAVVHIDRNTGEIYVVDGKSRILVYTADMFPLYTINSKNGIEVPHGVIVDDEGTLFVTQAPSKENPRYRISVLNACLKWERDIYIEGFEGAESFEPSNLALDKSGLIYVTGKFSPRVLAMNKKGDLIGILSPEEDGKKIKLNNIALDDNGNIYLLSEDKGRVYVYDRDRNFLFKFGEKGGSTGKMSRPRGIGVDNRNGRIYVVDYMRHTTSVYDSKGKFMFEFGGLGWGEGWFQHPVDIALDKEGKIYVADRFNQRIQIFQSWERTGKDAIPGKKILVVKKGIINR